MEFNFCIALIEDYLNIIRFYLPFLIYNLMARGKKINSGLKTTTIRFGHECTLFCKLSKLV